MRFKPVVSFKSIKKCFKNSRVIVTPLIVLALIATIFGGCRTLETGKVYKDWSRTMSQLGIFPIYPPREDVQVGDIYVLPTHPLDTGAVEAIGGLGFTGVWIENIKGSSMAATEFYGNRGSFPKTSEGVIANIGEVGSDTPYYEAISKIMPVPRSGTATLNSYEIETGIGTSTTIVYSIFGTGDTQRLRQVAFPEFSVTNITQVGLEALVPVEVFNVAAGFLSNNVEQISLKIPSAESYGLPMKNILALAGKCKKCREGTEIKDCDDCGKLLKFSSIEEVCCDINKKNCCKKKCCKDKNNKVGCVKGNCNGNDCLKPEFSVKNISGLDGHTALMMRSMFDESIAAMENNVPSSWNSLTHKTQLAKMLRKSSGSLWIALISEVFYARSMDISIQSTKSLSGGVNVQPVTNAMLTELDRLDMLDRMKRLEVVKPGTTTAGTVNVVTGTTNTGTATTTSTAIADTAGRTMVNLTEIEKNMDPFTLAKEMQEFNKQISNQSVPGGSVSVVSVTKSSVGLRRTFDRPIAVGARGVVIRIDLNETTLENLKQGNFKVHLNGSSQEKCCGKIFPWKSRSYMTKPCN